MVRTIAKVQFNHATPSNRAERHIVELEWWRR